ncbi:DUF1120 domain-containing protein [Pseudomonas sp. SDO524_S393]
MKLLIKTVVLASALAGASHTFAVSSIDLTVKGVITPAACTPSLPGGGVVDYGKISVQDLNPSGFTKLPEARVQLTVVCDAQTLMAIKTTDNRTGTASGGHFGLGLSTSGKRIGGYDLLTQNETGDGVSGFMIETSDLGMGWMSVDGAGWQPGWMRTLGGGSGSNLFPLAVKTLQTDVVVLPLISDKNTLPLDEEIELDGHLSFSVVYL